MEAALKALSDPRRRAIVELLVVRDRPVGELAERLPIAQSGVSRHLRILKDAGVVQVRADGQRRVYSLRPEPLDELAGWLAEQRGVWERRLDRFETELARRVGQEDES